MAESNKLSLDWDCAQKDCKHCGYVQENPSTLLTHYYAVHFSCPKCDVTFENKADIIEHIESVHQLDVKCQYCDYTSFYKGHLESHLIKKHSKKGTFEHLNCSLCTEFKCRTNSEMEKHCRHKHFNCFRCDIQFNGKSEMADHLEEHHNCSDLKVSIYNCLSNLKKHL